MPNSTPNISYTTIDLLRHGAVQGGACYRGVKDDPLSKAGWKQMLQSTHKQSWDAIISSPLCRCADFARHLSPDCNVHNNLKEIDFGDWEGKTAETLIQQSPARFKQFMLDPENNSPPNGEKLSSFRQRIIREWHQIIKQYQAKHILIVSHGGTMRAIISHILNMPNKDMMRLAVPYASMSRIKIYHDDESEGDKTYPSLVFHGKEINCD